MIPFDGATMALLLMGVGLGYGFGFVVGCDYGRAHPVDAHRP